MYMPVDSPSSVVYGRLSSQALYTCSLLLPLDLYSHFRTNMARRDLET